MDPDEAEQFGLVVEVDGVDHQGLAVPVGSLGTTVVAADFKLLPTTISFAGLDLGPVSPTAGTPPQPGLSYVLEWPQGADIADATTHLAANYSLFTFLQNNTLISALAVDSSGSIYVGGQSQAAFNLGPLLSIPAPGGTSAAFELIFSPLTIASVTVPTITGFSYIDGPGNETVTGIGVDPTSGKSYLFGNTTSASLAAESYPLQNLSPYTSPVGFIAQLPLPVTFSSSDTTPPILPVPTNIPALTYFGGSGSTDKITSGTVAPNGAVYVTGQTDAPASNAGTGVALGGTATTQNSSAPFNGSALAYGQDQTSGGVKHGYLASLNPSGAVWAVNYIANLGASGGADIANAVAVDPSTQNAFVAATIGHASIAAPTPPYTSYTSYQTTSPATGSNVSAYIAEVAHAASTAALHLQPATSGTPSTDPIGYSTDEPFSVSYTWTLESSTEVKDLVVRVPAITGLSFLAADHSGNGLTITDASGGTITSACAATGSGAECHVSGIPQTTPGTSDTLRIVLKASTTSSLTGTSVDVTAEARSSASDYAASSQTSTISPPVHYTITPATTFPATTVAAGSSAIAGTQLSYTVIAVNDSGNDSHGTSLTVNSLPTNFTATSASATINGTATTCGSSVTTSGCGSFTLPAGATLQYILTGYYTDATVPQASTSIVTTSPLGVTVKNEFTTATASIATNTTVQRQAHLTATNALSAGTTSASAINLGATEIYTVTISNSGPSASSGLDTYDLTLPAGFTPDTSHGPACTTHCAVAVIAAGGSTTVTVTGTFQDASTNSAIGKTVVAQSFAVALTPVNTENAVVSNASATAYVQRTAVLHIATNNLGSPATVCAGGTACVYMQNGAGLDDKVAYNFAISNAGPNVATNATVTITLPSTAGSSFAAGTPSVSATAPAFGSAPACSYNSATNQITCTVGNIPVTTGGATASLRITGNGVFNDAAVPATASFVRSSTGAINVTEDANGSPTLDGTIAAVEVGRAAHLVTTASVAAAGTSPALPINLDEHPGTASGGVDDAFRMTVNVGNTALNDAPGVTVTETLPAWFELVTAPAVSCTVAGAPVAAGYTTGAATVPMRCSLGTVSAGNAVASSSGTVSAGTSAVSFSYTGKFLDNGVGADITGATFTAKVKQLTASLGAAGAATPLAVDPIAPSDATSAAQSVAVRRLAHLILRKTRNTTVAAAPASFADKTDPNLDEKTTSTPFGVNDEVEYDLAVGNAGVNSAIGVQFTETLPPYFTVERAYIVSGASTAPDTGANAAPANQLPLATSLACYAGSAAAGTSITWPVSTGAASQTITCTYGTPANPRALLKGASTTGAPDNATAVEFVYQGKYQDNAPNADNLGNGMSTYTVASVAGEAAAVSALVVDNGPATDSRNLALPAYAIQRAAHLAIVAAPAVLQVNDTALPIGPCGVPMVGEAQPSSSGGNPVFNCLRYKVLVQNSGPNIARQPQLTVAAPSGFRLTDVSSALSTAPASDVLPSSCTYGASAGSSATGAAISPVSQTPGNTLILDVDGYFDLNTLTGGNSASGVAMGYTALADKGTMDSAVGSPFTPPAASAVTVVNTPVGNNFVVMPLSTTGARPATITFGSVVTPGITSAGVSASGPALPSGPSPDPRDNQKTIPLYRTGTSPQFYSLGTTAIPAPGTNPTEVCLTNGALTGALADGFAKPERVLLWALAGLPTGTRLYPVPRVSAPYTGDITTSVTPVGGGSYVAPGGPAQPYTTYAELPGPQSQPGQVCGQINGFAPAAAALTVAVLEPVNFAPYIGSSSQQTVQPPGKGVSEASFVFPDITHDYNDSDPCFVSSSTAGTPARGVCDDNLLLTTWVFGGERMVPSLSHVIGPLSPTAAQAFLNPAAPYEVQAGTTLFLQLADQLAAFAYNAKHNCDPGNASGTYFASTVNACPINPGLLTGTPPQETVFGSADIASLAVSVTGGSGGLIALPPAQDATSPTTPVEDGYTMASATVIAGQTVGFQWRLGDIMPAAGGTYNLTCYMVDAATQNTATPLPAGLSCQIPPSITYPANPTPANSPAGPAIYVVSTGAQTSKAVTPGWRAAAEGVVAALLLPLVLVRRRIGNSKRLGLVVLLLLLGGAASLSGCGAGFSAATTAANSTPAASGTYYFRANATPVQGGTTLTTAPFKVTVVAGQ